MTRRVSLQLLVVAIVTSSLIALAPGLARATENLEVSGASTWKVKVQEARIDGEQTLSMKNLEIAAPDVRAAEILGQERSDAIATGLYGVLALFGVMVLWLLVRWRRHRKSLRLDRLDLLEIERSAQMVLPEIDEETLNAMYLDDTSPTGHLSTYIAQAQDDGDEPEDGDTAGHSVEPGFQFGPADSGDPSRSE